MSHICYQFCSSAFSSCCPSFPALLLLPVSLAVLSVLTLTPVSCPSSGQPWNLEQSATLGSHSRPATPVSELLLGFPVLSLPAPHRPLCFAINTLPHSCLHVCLCLGSPVLKPPSSDHLKLTSLKALIGDLWESWTSLFCQTGKLTSILAQTAKVPSCQKCHQSHMAAF